MPSNEGTWGFVSPSRQDVNKFVHTALAVHCSLPVALSGLAIGYRDSSVCLHRRTVVFVSTGRRCMHWSTGGVKIATAAPVHPVL